MKKLFKILTACTLAIAMTLCLAACGTDSGNSQETENKNYTVGDAESVYKDAHIIKLNGQTATLDGTDVEVFDYTWHCDPSTSHDEVKNAPAEYYTGTEPETDAAVYIDQELYYYPELEVSGFTKVNYDGEQEYAYYYTDGEHNDFIFATLPVLGSDIPTAMMHSEEEAANNKVLHITEAGTYILEGEWDGQIWVDLGDEDETFTDENAKITVILNGVDITCTVAPGVVFYSAYECDNTWEDQESWSYDVDTSNAGVNVIVADGSVNNVDGQNIYRMLKTKYKDEDSTDAVKVQKKMRKIDSAFYSFVTMNIDGGDEDTGVLNVTSSFEGLDSELHLSFNGANININSQDDGINVNEDYVSVISINGGNVTLNPAQGAEGDGIDSNGYIVINGGTFSCNGVVAPDSALDSECGCYYFGGTVIVDGTEASYTAGDVIRESMGGGGMGGMIPGNFDLEDMMGELDVQALKEKIAALPDDATWTDVMEVFQDLGLNFGSQGGIGGGMGNIDPSQMGDFDPTQIGGGNVSGGAVDPGQMNGNGQGGTMPGSNGGGQVPSMPDGNGENGNSQTPPDMP